MLRWLRLAALAAILVAAVALRVAWPGVAEFKLDEVQPLALADQVWSQHRLPLTRGYSSTGLPGTPLVGYLLVLPRAISRDPQVAVAFMGLLGALAVACTYLGVRRFAGEPLALVSSALYAVNPWAIFFSRKTWSDALPLLTVLMLWAAYEVVVRRKPAWGLAFLALLALQVQCHVIAILYLPAAALTVLLFWPRWRNRYTLYGVGAGALILMPYLVALAGRRGNLGALVQRNVGHGWIVDLRAVIYGLWFTSGATVTALMGRSVAVLRGWEQALRGVSLLTEVLLLGALGLCGWAALRRRQGYERQALLLIWLAGPVLPLIFVRGAMDMHYLQLLVPALFILVGMAWTRLMSVRRRVVALGAGLAFAAVLALQAGAVLAVYQGVMRYPTDGGFGLPLGLWLGVQRGVQERIAAEGIRNVQVLSPDDGSWPSLQAALNLLLQRDADLRYVGQGGRQGLLVPESGDGLALVLAAGNELQEALGRFGREEARWPVPGSEWGTRLYRVQAQDAARLARDITMAPAETFENGMRLLGARLPEAARAGETVVIASYWRFEAPGAGPSTADTSFNHLVDASGRRWAQDDGFALGRTGWRQGETLVQWFQLKLPADLPPGEYWLYSGMYSWQDGSRAQVLDAAGRWLSDGVKLGPILVGGG